MEEEITTSQISKEFSSLVGAIPKLRTAHQQANSHSPQLTSETIGPLPAFLDGWSSLSIKAVFDADHPNLSVWRRLRSEGETLFTALRDGVKLQFYSNPWWDHCCGVHEAKNIEAPFDLIDVRQWKRTRELMNGSRFDPLLQCWNDILEFCRSLEVFQRVVDDEIFVFLLQTSGWEERTVYSSGAGGAKAGVIDEDGIIARLNPGGSIMAALEGQFDETERAIEKIDAEQNRERAVREEIETEIGRLAISTEDMRREIARIKEEEMAANEKEEKERARIVAMGELVEDFYQGAVTFVKAVANKKRVNISDYADPTGGLDDLASFMQRVGTRILHLQ
jgi:hypothetical protein